MIFRHDLFTKQQGTITVRAWVELDDDADTSWMDEDAQKAVRDGELIAFGTIVEIERNGHTIGRDALWGSFCDDYDDPYLLGVARTQVGPEALADARKTLGL